MTSTVTVKTVEVQQACMHLLQDIERKLLCERNEFIHARMNLEPGWFGRKRARSHAQAVAEWETPSMGDNLWPSEEALARHMLEVDAIPVRQTLAAIEKSVSEHMLLDVDV